MEVPKNICSFKTQRFRVWKTEFRIEHPGRNESVLKFTESFKCQPFDISGILQTSISNNIMSISIGRRFAYDDPKFTRFIRLLNENINNAAFAGPANFLPALANLPVDPFGITRIMNNFKEVFVFLEDEIKDHKKTLDENNIRDYVDCYLIEMKENKQKGIYTEEQLLSSIGDLFAAGTETTATTIRWALVYLMRNVNIQKKMRTEIDEVVGSSRFPCLADKPNLPYCEAVISETLRIGNIVPISLPHKVSEDIFFKGYKIPKDSVIMPCIESVGFDEKLFPDSKRFYPERFIDENGKVFGQEKVLSFSLGRRVCLGEALARMELFLYLTAMIQKFEFLPPEGEEPPTTNGTFGVVHSPIKYKLRALPRY